MADEDRLPFDEIRDEDLQDPKDLPIDTAKIEEHLRNLHNNVYEYIAELLQNGLDSGDEGEPNIVHIFKPKNPLICLACTDEGKSLAGDYDQDINKFLAAKKGTSNKPKKKGKAGKLGLGMFDYTPNISKYALFITLDGKGLITKVVMHINPKTNLVAWGTPQMVPATKENRQKFGIYKMGTHVYFFNRDPSKPEINFALVKKKATDIVPLILARNPNVHLRIQNSWIHVPAEFVDNPEKLIAKTKYGDITGALWFAEKGNGAIKIFVNGYYIETISFKPVKCFGYVNFDALDINRARTGIIKDNKIFELLRDELLEQMKKFPAIESEQTAPKDTKEIIFKALKDLIPKIPLKLGPKAGLIKEESTGVAGGTEIGYVSEHEQTGIKRPGITRGPNENHLTVTETTDGTGKKIKVVKSQKGRETEERDLDVIEREIDENKPLCIPHPELKPLLIELNKLNAEFIPYALEKTNKKVRWDLIVNALAECRVIIKVYAGLMPAEYLENFETIRMALSIERVTILKALGLYPTVDIVKSIRGHGSASTSD